MALPSPELKQFLDALEAFGEKPPRDLPDGVLDTAKELGRSLRGYSGDYSDRLSPGDREAKQAQGSDTAVPYPDAVKGHDQPSPGQREFSQVQERARELADSLSSMGSEKQ